MSDLDDFLRRRMHDPSLQPTAEQRAEIKARIRAESAAFLAKNPNWRRPPTVGELDARLRKLEAERGINAAPEPGGRVTIEGTGARLARLEALAGMPPLRRDSEEEGKG